MNRSIPALLALGLFAAPAANAEIVTWEIRGVVTEIDGGPDNAFEGLTVGDAYRFRWVFDTAAALQLESPAGHYRYDGSATSLAVDVGPLSGLAIAPSPLSRTILRDDSLVGETITDGISFNHVSFDPADGGFYTFISHVMRGTVLDIFSGPALPKLPDPRLADLDIAALSICRTTSDIAADCALGFLGGSIDSIRLVSCDNNLDAIFCDGYELLE